MDKSRSKASYVMFDESGFSRDASFARDDRRG